MSLQPAEVSDKPMPSHHCQILAFFLQHHDKIQRTQFLMTSARAEKRMFPKALNRIFCWSFDNIDIEEKNVVKID